MRVDAAGSGPSAQPGPLLPPQLQSRVERASAAAVAGLEAERGPAGHWTGELSASALSTATAVVALTLVGRRDADADRRTSGLVAAGFRWLVEHQNPDGGWGDTVRSRSNLSTTTLVWAALALAPAEAAGVAPAAELAGQWIRRAAGSLEPAALVRAIEARYGRDRTFSIPILTLSALCGRLGEGVEAWRWVRQLPFEIAVLPQRWFGALQLPVVSYALPALIAIGQVRHGLRPTPNPVWRALRNRCRAPTLEKLSTLQPPNGGFLEATPLTSFVTMSLAGLGLVEHPVVRKGVEFIVASVRPDGSWPIDTNLATWVTTLAVQALGPRKSAAGSEAREKETRLKLLSWILRQQYRVVHPYTLAAPGGWAWTDLPGGVPDADDTPGALLALRQLGAGADPEARTAAAAGVAWLLDLQNRDGGVPTFCRGWGRLPFDRSSPDLTAHAVRAWIAWRDGLAPAGRDRIDRALRRAWKFLQATQRADGAWVPLWFGHQDAPDDENPLYGTARVVPALCDLLAAEVERASTGQGDVRPMLDRAVAWLLAQQHADGGWSAAEGAEPSAEETGVAVEALATAWAGGWVASDRRTATQQALRRGAAWLCDAVESGRWREPSPIGFYFAKLWYFERLYPMIFTTGALVRLARGAG